MLFQRSIAVIYLIAFSSLLSQIKALFFSNGISPIKTIVLNSGSQQVPSLFHLNSSDAFLYSCNWLGLLIATLLALNLIKNKHLKAFLFFILYFLYLSFVNIGGVFLSFQWDSLLLETGLWLVVFILVSGDKKLETLAKWIFFIMIFKLMFMSGLVKLSSLDKTWADFTALSYHYQTQPIPNPLSSYFHSLPKSFHKLSCIIMFFIELVMPFFIFCGKKARHLAGLSFIALQLLIMLSGNYCFFNLLTIILCLPLLDYRELQLKRFKLLESSEDIMLTNPSISNFLDRESSKKNKIVMVLLISALFFYGTVSLLHILNRSNLNLKFINQVSRIYLRNFGAYYVNNPYGLFAMMTKKRYEIIFQGANDVPGQFAKSDWKTYEFKYKPGKLNRTPPIIAPFQPRLDWQMWFAALSSYQSNPWLINFAVKLLENNKEVLKLLDYNPYPDKAPKYIRALIYEYQFSNLNDENLWQRELKGLYLPAISLKAESVN